MNEQDKEVIKSTLTTLVNLVFNAEASKSTSNEEEVKRNKRELLDHINTLFEEK